jgi:hypothetical protein
MFTYVKTVMNTISGNDGFASLLEFRAIDEVHKPSDCVISASLVTADPT